MEYTLADHIWQVDLLYEVGLRLPGHDLIPSHLIDLSGMAVMFFNQVSVSLFSRGGIDC